MASAPGGMEIIETKYVVWYIVGAAGDACDAGILIHTHYCVHKHRERHMYILQYKYIHGTCTMYIVQGTVRSQKL